MAEGVIAGPYRTPLTRGPSAFCWPAAWSSAAVAVVGLGTDGENGVLYVLVGAGLADAGTKTPSRMRTTAGAKTLMECHALILLKPPQRWRRDFARRDGRGNLPVAPHRPSERSASSTISLTGPPRAVGEPGGHKFRGDSRPRERTLPSLRLPPSSLDPCPCASLRRWARTQPRLVGCPPASWESHGAGQGHLGCIPVAAHPALRPNERAKLAPDCTRYASAGLRQPGRPCRRSGPRHSQHPLFARPVDPLIRPRAAWTGV